MRAIILAAVVILMIGCNQKKDKDEKKEEETSETIETMAKQDWEILFDGNSFDGWHFYRGGEITEPWKLEDGAMVFYPPADRPEGESYNIVTDKEYHNFVLSLEWKVTEGANSGIFWGVHEDEKYNQPYETGPEIQVLDNERHPDAKNGTTHQAGALYDMVAPSNDVTKPAGQWNTCVITVNHDENKGNVVLNGEQIVEFPVNGELWQVMVNNSKFANWEGFGKYPIGKIGLQDHGDVVAFRNIKIKEL